jgi:hypothetical protein
VRKACGGCGDARYPEGYECQMNPGTSDELRDVNLRRSDGVCGGRHEPRQQFEAVKKAAPSDAIVARRSRRTSMYANQSAITGPDPAAAAKASSAAVLGPFRDRCGVGRRRVTSVTVRPVATAART